MLMYEWKSASPSYYPFLPTFLPGGCDIRKDKLTSNCGSVDLPLLNRTSGVKINTCSMCLACDCEVAQCRSKCKSECDSRKGSLTMYKAPSTPTPTSGCSGGCGVRGFAIAGPMFLGVLRFVF